ncbi:hypothetical protein D9M72_559060 [compost metagenome]
MDDVLVDAVALADDDLAVRRKQFSRRRHRQPVRVPEGSAPGALYRFGDHSGNARGHSHGHEANDCADDSDHVEIGQRLIP